MTPTCPEKKASLLDCLISSDVKPLKGIQVGSHLRISRFPESWVSVVWGASTVSVAKTGDNFISRVETKDA